MSMSGTIRDEPALDRLVVRRRTYGTRSTMCMPVGLILGYVYVYCFSMDGDETVQRNRRANQVGLSSYTDTSLLRRSDHREFCTQIVRAHQNSKRHEKK